jgi:hypothetical protein
MGEMKPAYKVLVVKPGGKRPIESRRGRCHISVEIRLNETKYIGRC